MDILIRGVEMPENCLQCAFFSGCGCKATRSLFPDLTNVAVRAKECPIVPVPLIDVVQNLPAADVRENVKSKWVTVEDWDGDEHYRCFACGIEWFLEAGTPNENNMNFCPNCGADMRGDTDGVEL